MDVQITYRDQLKKGEPPVAKYIPETFKVTVNFAIAKPPRSQRHGPWNFINNPPSSDYVQPKSCNGN